MGSRDLLDTGDDVGQGSTSVIAQDLDGDQIHALGDTILSRSDRSRTVTSVSVPIKVLGTTRDCLSPPRTAFEFNVGNVDSRVDDVDVDAAVRVECVRGVGVFGECGEAKGGAVGDPCEAPGCGGLHHYAAVRGVGSRGENVGFGVYGRRKGAV